LPFEVALCGERFGLKAPALDEGIQTLGKRIIHDGYANDDLYRRLLWQSSLTFSTALHEYFGISMLEGIHANTLPFLPRRLSYPEIIPAAFHEICLYEGQELLSRLRWGLANPQEARAVAARLAEATAGYAWPLMAAEYDRRFEALLAASRPRPR
jgi:hypothetical protein